MRQLGDATRKLCDARGVITAPQGTAGSDAQNTKSTSKCGEKGRLSASSQLLEGVTNNQKTDVVLFERPNHDFQKIC